MSLRSRLSGRPTLARRFVPALEPLEDRDLLAVLPYGSIASGTISSAGASAFQDYTFSATRGAIFTLAMTSTATQAGFDAFADVTAPSGALVDQFFATGQRYLTAEETGTYRVRVHDSNFAQTGTFTLGLEGITPRSPSPAALVRGGIVSGTIDAPIDVKQFTFTGQPGNIITLAMSSTATESGFDAYADVFAPSGALVDQFFATGQRYLTLEEGGTFTVQVHDSNYAQRGSFRIGLEGITPRSPSPAALVRGGIVSGTIDASIDVKQLIFTGQQGDVITLAMSSTATESGFDAYADVFAPSGALVDQFFATGQRYLTLSESGTFTVQVHDSNYAQRGSFRIGLEGISPISPSPRALVPGGFVTDSVTSGIDVKQFTFSAAEGNLLALSLTSTATQAGFDAYADVFAPSGALIDQFFATGLRYLTAPETGTYMVQLHDSNYQQAGSYKIGLEGITPPSPDALAVTPGQTFTGVIGQSNDNIQYLFHGRANDQIRVTLTSTATQAGFDAFADVFASSGALIDQFFVANQRTITLGEAGVYLIQIHDSNFAQTGRSTLRVDWVTTASSISGTVYNDANANGAREGEAGLAGRRLFLDLNNNGARESNELLTTTDAMGNYAFTALSAGTYIVRQILPSGWLFTSPASGALSVTVGAGQNATGRNFGNTQSPQANAVISGRVFNDANGNGVRDVSELGLGLWTVFIDANNDGVQQATEKSVQTDRHGNYSLTGLVAGTYVVRVETVSGVRTTTPSTGKYTVTLSTGLIVSGRDFGQLGTL